MKNVESKSQFEELFRQEFIRPKLTEWLNWVTGKDDHHFVALPMIQRGSVWNSKQIITLWDSLLRGMPIGSLMLSRLNSRDGHGQAILVRRIGSTQLQPVIEGGGAALVDGQQRTLAMLLGWPHLADEQKQSRTLWVDFADKPAPENLFRMHVTSTAHPYGFSRADPNTKLSLHERRHARENKDMSDGQQFPWDSHLPIRLTTLIQIYLDVGQDSRRWKDVVLSQLRQEKKHRNKNWEEFEADGLKALERFAECLPVLFKIKIPLIAIPDTCFAESETQEGEDPALALLFKRLGTGGTTLSDADYVYSVIKHQLPETFQLVESIAARKGFSQLLGPTDIVMTAVRLVAAEIGMTDFESPNKANFDGLRKNPEFLLSFLDLVKSGRLSRALIALTECLKFNAERSDIDPGLPMHGFIITSRPVLQILLRWLLAKTKSHEDDQERMRDLLDESRNEMLRFVLYAYLALPDQRKASALAFPWLKENSSTDSDLFPGRQLVHHLLELRVTKDREVAWPLPSKDIFNELALSKGYEKAKPILGSERFHTLEESKRQPMHVFRRWWGNGNRYQHVLLLWLQRAYVDKIEKNPDEVRSDDEVPYDFDHICPSSHWGGWAGIKRNDRLLDFLAKADNKGHLYVGNSIGNLRVWYASDNRGDGNSTAAVKLYQNGGDDGLNNDFLKDSAIQPIHAALWNDCSGGDEGTVWSDIRAMAFQNAVEHRACDLYARYFDELNFHEWFPSPGSQAAPATAK